MPHQPLLLTAAAATVLTALFDLGSIAAIGVFLYLTMDSAVQWGVLRRLHERIGANRVLPAATIVMDVVILGAFATIAVQSDLANVVVAAVIAAAIFAAQAWAISRRRPRTPSQERSS